VNESEFILEVIDPVTGEPATDGELVLTNLGRIGSPLIRYRTGDHVRLAEGKCPCGRTFRRLAGGILGRLDDMLIVRGVNVFPAAIEGVVRRFSAIEEFQIEVFNDGELDEVRLLIELDDAAGVRSVQEALRTILGIRVEVAIFAGSEKSSCIPSGRTVIEIGTTDRTRSGWDTASSIATAPPIEWPRTCAWSMPRWSSRAMTSEAELAGEMTRSMSAVRPWPCSSTAMTRWRGARRVM